MMTRRFPRALRPPVLVLGLAAAYFAAARLGLLMQLPGTNASPVWPPSGIGLAAAVLCGLRAWPGIALGAFLANVLTLPPTPAGFCAAAAIAAGNTLEAVAALLALRRLVPSLAPFDRPRDLLYFLVTTAVACAVAGTVGAASLWLTGIIADHLFASVWFTWWLGDAAGVVVLAPAVVSWARPPRDRLTAGRRLELAALVGVTALTAELTFGGWLPVDVPFLVVAGPLWAAFRFGPRETSLLPVLLSVVTVTHVWQWSGRASGPGLGDGVYVPFVSGAAGVNDSLLMLQLFVCGVGVTAVILAAAVAERNRTEDRLRESESRFRTIFEQAAVGVALIETGTGRFTRVNRRYGSLIGYSAEEMTRLTFMELTHPEDLEADLGQMRRLVAGEVDEFTLEKRLFRKDGGVVWVNLTVSPTWRAGEAPEHHIAIVEDITARRRAEESRRESEERYRILADALPHMVWTMRPDLSLEFLNPWAAGFTGLSADEVNAGGWGRLVHPDDQPGMLAAVSGPLGRGEPHEVEYRFRHHTGEYRWVVSRAVPVKDPAGAVTKWIGNTIDVHDRRTTEDRLRASERRYRALVQATPQVVWTAGGADGGGQEWWVELTGQAAAEAAGWGWLDAVHPADRERVRAAWASAYGTLTLYDTEYRIRTRRGEYRYFAVRGVALCDAGGRLEEWVGTLTDVHARRVAEEQLRGLNVTLERRIAERTSELRGSELRFRTMVEGVRDYAIFMLDPDGRVATWNAGAERLKGYSAEEIVGQHFSRFYPAEVVANGWTAHELDVARTAGRFEDEGWRVRKDGSRFWANVVISVLHDEAGRLTGFSKVTRDLTQRKQVEEARRESERRFRAIFHSQFQFIGLLALDGTVLEVNQTALAVAGVSKEAVLGRPFWETAWWGHDPAVRDRHRDAVARAAAGEQVRFETRYAAADGGLNWLAYSLTPFRDDDGRVVFLIPEGHDVTEQKRAQDALRLQEERFRSAFEFAPIGLALVGLDGRWLRVNRSLCEIVGYPEDELLATDFQTITHPADLDADLGHVRELLAGAARTYQMEKRYFHKAGRTVSVLLSVSLVRDGGGAPLYFISQIQDITQRKQAEQKLAANQALLDEFIQHTPAAIAMLDTEMRYIRTSDRWMTDYQLGGQAILGRSHYDVFPDIPDRWRQAHRRVLAGGIETCAEDPFRRDTGETEWLQWEARPWHTAEGRVGGLLFFTQVITQRKRDQELLLTSVREKEVMLREIHHRVKNNLAVISSLFGLQARALRDDAAVRVLREAQDRVQSMALVHEHLYNSDDLGAVAFGEYARTLAGQIFQTYRLPESGITLNSEVEAVRLSVDQAIPCGLILNELMSNCLKHAFRDRDRGQVRLTLAARDGVCLLQVADDGVGLPAELDVRSARSLGVRLVRTLARQLDGAVEYRSTDRGVEVQLTFPLATDPKARLPVPGPAPTFVPRPE